MSITIENGYIYVDLEPKSIENINEEKSSDDSDDSNSLWIWFLVVFVFAIILLFTTWYGNSYTKSPMSPRGKILSPRI